MLRHYNNDVPNLCPMLRQWDSVGPRRTDPEGTLLWKKFTGIYGNSCINVPVKSSLYKWTLGEKKYTGTS